MGLSKRRRFAVLRRDGFACRYCGSTVEDGVALHVDHVIARSRGGSDDSENLVTACSDCNLGKSDTSLDDALPPPLDIVAAKEIQRRAQAYNDWLREQERLREAAIDGVIEFWNRKIGWYLPSNCRAMVGAWVDRMAEMEIIQFIRTIFDRQPRFRGYAYRYVNAAIHSHVRERDG